MGGLYLTSDSKYLREIYPEDAVMSYKSIKECIDICNKILQNPSNYISIGIKLIILQLIIHGKIGWQC